MPKLTGQTSRLRKNYMLATGLGEGEREHEKLHGARRSNRN
ncbi:hypothetical protein ApDm4_0696 [Acetobacter pomorum]|nr:hypothetical protein ApDm4_0696 [Acetobacter pomorum]